MGSGEDSFPGFQKAACTLCAHMAFPQYMHVKGGGDVGRMHVLLCFFIFL